MRTSTSQRQLKMFGANLRRERRIRGFTQAQLAEMVDLNPRTLQRVESGQVNVLTTTAIRIRYALDCPWERLLPLA